MYKHGNDNRVYKETQSQVKRKKKSETRSLMY